MVANRELFVRIVKAKKALLIAKAKGLHEEAHCQRLVLSVLCDGVPSWFVRDAYNTARKLAERRF